MFSVIVKAIIVALCAYITFSCVNMITNKKIKVAASKELMETGNVQVYKRKNNSYISRSFLLRKSVLDGLYELKKKYRIPIYLLVNIAIRNVLIEEGLMQLQFCKKLLGGGVSYMFLKIKPFHYIQKENLI